jgi:rRNA-processing protein FCF1
MKVILDTNFLVYCAKQKIHYKEGIQNLVREQYDLVTVSNVVEELEKLTQTSKKYADKQAAELALKLLKANEVKIIKSPGRYADDAIINASNKAIVATLDIGLIKYLEKAIIIRGKKKLVFK